MRSGASLNCRGARDRNQERRREHAGPRLVLPPTHRALPIRMVVGTVVIRLGMDAAVPSATRAAAAHPMT